MSLTNISVGTSKNTKINLFVEYQPWSVPQGAPKKVAESRWRSQVFSVSLKLTILNALIAPRENISSKLIKLQILI